jgi:hypothetical protein
MAHDKTAPGDATPRNPRGKYITLAVLLLWVAAVLLFTFFKFSKSIA